MLTISYGTHLDTLADTLVEELRASSRKQVLAPELFIVQNYGMARWLSLYMAEKDGVAANLKFKFPAEVYWQIMRVMDSSIPDELPSERTPMRWAIFSILLNDTDPELGKLHDYIRHAELEKEQVRCWNLAGRIADVYDQYLTYRPDMLLGWEEHLPVYATDFSTERWQAALWRKLSARWGTLNNTGRSRVRMHRAALHKKLIQEIKSGIIGTDKLPQRITIFGVSEMPEAYIELLAHLSSHIDIQFFIVDANSAHDDPLIDSMGQVGRDFKDLIHSFGEKGVSLRTRRTEPAPDSKKNLLKSVRHALLGEQEASGAERSGLRPEEDNSIQIHSCHSPRREVEVLYDQLLAMFDKSPDIEPSDILVLCPQIETYGPEIEAVFGVVEEGVPEIPYHLAEGGVSAHPVDLAFRKLMNLIKSRFKITDVLDLMDSRPIRQAFSFSEEDTRDIERWIDENQIHWGIDAEHKRILGLPPTNSFTWRAGLNRMMAGYAMQRDNARLYHKIFPYDEITQSEHAQLLGRFSHFTNQLMACLQQADEGHTLSKWGDIFNAWISAFFTERESDFHAIQRLRQAVQSLDAMAKQAGTDRMITFRVVCSYLEEQLDQHGTGGGRPGKGVTFSGMVPMRNIPARVICMIGMNEGAFPRAKDMVQFNLINLDPHKGDRLPGKEDRQVFLENIIAAKEQLYFSYTGQSNKKETQFPPSVVLQEFIDYLENAHEINLGNKIQDHRLQSFSRHYFENTSRQGFLSYSENNAEVASRLSIAGNERNRFIPGDLPEPDTSYQKIAAHELVSFFQHPARYLLQQRLGLSLNEDRVLDEDRERFDLDGLQRYQIGQEMLDHYMKDTTSLKAYRDIAFARDLLPEGWPGEDAYNSQAAKVREFALAIETESVHECYDPVEVHIEQAGIQLTGYLKQVFDHRQLLFRFGRLRAKDVLELWIKHLLLQEGMPEGHSRQSRMYTRHKRKGVVYLQLEPVNDHRETLLTLLHYYREGLQQNIHFYPQSSYAYAEKVLYKDADPEAGMKAAEREWVDRYRGVQKEGDDPYNKYVTDSFSPFTDKDLGHIFKKVSMSIWGPVFEAMGEKEGVAE